MVEMIIDVGNRLNELIRDSIISCSPRWANKNPKFVNLLS